MISPIYRYQDGLGPSLQHKLSPKVPYGRDFQMCMGDPGVRRDICYHLLKSWHRSLPPVFTCYWKENNRASWRRDVGAGYYSGGIATYLEVCEEGLELSRILDGLEIDGIYSGGITSCVGYLSDSSIVELFIKNWEDFFLREPDGVYVQYVYRVSGLAVNIALEAFSKRDQVLVVAINVTTPIQHSRQISLRLPDHFCGKTSKEVLVYRHPGNSGSLFLRFSDPTFYSSIVCAYLLEILHEPGQDPDESLSHSLASVPFLVHTDLSKPVFIYEPIILRYVERGIFLDHFPQVNDACLAALEGRELWNETLLARISWFVVGCVRMVDYLLAIIRTSRSMTSLQNAAPSHFNDTTTTEAPYSTAALFTAGQAFIANLETSVTLWVAECVWVVFSAAQALIACGMLKRNPDLHLLPLHCNIVGHVLTGLDLIYNVYMAATGASSIHCALGAYDVAFLTRSGLCFFPKIRQSLQHSAILITNWRSIGCMRSASIVVVSNAFRSTMKKSRIFLESVFLLVVSGLFFTRHLVTNSREEPISGDLIHAIFSGAMILFIAHTLQTKHPAR